MQKVLRRATRPGAPVAMLAVHPDAALVVRRWRNLPADLLAQESGLSDPWLFPDPPHLADLGVDPAKAKVVRGLLRILRACGPLSAADLTTAWARGSRQAGHTSLPANAAITGDWLRYSPAFRPAHPDPATGGGHEPLFAPAVEVALDPTTEVLVAVLGPAAEGLDRATFRARCLAAGMNPATFAVATSYSPVLEHAGRDLWRLRGHAAPPPTPRARRPRPRKGSATRWTWNSAGDLALTARLPHVESPVVNVPAAVRDVVEGRTFAVVDTVVDADTHADTAIRLTCRNGVAWGFQSLLTQGGARPGDELTIAFRLADQTARVSLSGRPSNDTPTDLGNQSASQTGAR